MRAMPPPMGGKSNVSSIWVADRMTDKVVESLSFRLNRRRKQSPIMHTLTPDPRGNSARRRDRSWTQAQERGCNRAGGAVTGPSLPAGQCGDMDPEPGPARSTPPERQVRSFEPDTVILARHATLLGEQRLKRLLRGRYSAFWYFDLRVPPIPDVVKLGRMVDAMFVTYLPTVETYRALGVSNVFHLPQGMDPELDQPARSVPDSIGARWPSSEAIRPTATRSCAMAHYDLQIRGPGWRKAPPDLPIAVGRSTGSLRAGGRWGGDLARRAFVA